MNTYEVSQMEEFTKIKKNGEDFLSFILIGAAMLSEEEQHVARLFIDEGYDDLVEELSQASFQFGAMVESKESEQFSVVSESRASDALELALVAIAADMSIDGTHATISVRLGLDN